MRKIYFSKIDSLRRVAHICIAAFHLPFCIFILSILIGNDEFVMQSSLYKILVILIYVTPLECIVLYEIRRWLLSAFNILVIKNDSIIRYTDPRCGYRISEFINEQILSKNKNKTIKVTGKLYIQPVYVHAKRNDHRSYTFIGTSPPFDGNAFICNKNQIIMRESPVFLSALKEKFEYEEMEPIVRDMSEMLKKEMIFN